MENKKTKIFMTLFLGLGITAANAQQVITTAGGNASGTGGSVSYSVGQIAYKTDSSSSGSIAQGVQQPFEISILTSIEEAIGIQLLCMAYPNPTTDFLFLKVENYNKENLLYHLYDINGKLLESKEITSSGATLTMNGFAAGTYFLKVMDSGTEAKSVKIIKN